MGLRHESNQGAATSQDAASGPARPAQPDLMRRQPRRRYGRSVRIQGDPAGLNLVGVDCSERESAATAAASREHVELDLDLGDSIEVAGYRIELIESEGGEVTLQVESVQPTAFDVMPAEEITDFGDLLGGPGLPR